LLYGGQFSRTPIVENFNAADLLFWDQYRAKSSQKSIHRPQILEILPGVNEIRNNELQLTPEKTWLGASLWHQAIISGDCWIEFTLQLKPGAGKPAHGLTLAILPADNISAKIGDLGKYLAYGRMAGFALTFDSFQNKDESDKEPDDVASKIMVRVNDSGKSKQIFPANLPEPLTKGHAVRVRLGFNTARRLVDVKAYSFGNDKSIDVVGQLPHDARLPPEKRIVFTAATGEDAQTIIIDDILIAPR
jgi:hypothetical protein